MKKYILIGNPNTGKTTLFNTITKSNEHVGNWHGVTVGVIEKKFIINGEECLMVDLPGLYSLDVYSMEEKISVDYLNNNKDATIINICDANNIERNLLLTLQLLSQGFKIIVAMNMSKENKNVDYKKLQDQLNTLVVEIDARNKKSVKRLIDKSNEVIVCDNNIKNLGSDAKSIFRYINFIMKKIYIKEFELKKSLSIVDKIVLNKFLFLPIFVVIISLVFYITFGTVGATLSSFLCDTLSIFTNNILKFISNNYGENILYYFLADGIFAGVSSVLAFLPQIGLLFFFLGLLEDIGYLPRVAFMLDGVLKKIGMTGRSLFSLLMGFGCTATALITTRNMDNYKLKKRTALILPFMSCSAKLPIFLVFASAFFVKYKVLFIILLYFLSIIMGILVSTIASKISKNKESDFFLLELPKYRIPRISKLLKDVLKHAITFIIKVGTVVLISSAIIWVLQSFTLDFRYISENNSGNNILSNIANLIYPIFKPLGFSSCYVVVVLLSGLIGKEMVVSAIGILNSTLITGLTVAESLLITTNPVTFNLASAVSFVIFILFYSPCISAFEVASKELGTKFALFSFVFQFVIAYLLSFVTYSIFTKNLAVIFVLVTIILALFVRFMLKLKKHKNIKCKSGSCYGCNQSCR